MDGSLCLRWRFQPKSSFFFFFRMQLATRVWQTQADRVLNLEEHQRCRNRVFLGKNDNYFKVQEVNEKGTWEWPWNNHFSSLNHPLSQANFSDSVVVSIRRTPLLLNQKKFPQKNCYKAWLFHVAKTGCESIKNTDFCHTSKGAIVSLRARHHTTTFAGVKVMKLKSANVPPLAGYLANS